MLLLLPMLLLLLMVVLALMLLLLVVEVLAVIAIVQRKNTGVTSTEHGSRCTLAQCSTTKHHPQPIAALHLCMHLQGQPRTK